MHHGTSTYDHPAIEARDELACITKSVTPTARSVLSLVLADPSYLTKSGRFHQQKIAKALGLNGATMREVCDELQSVFNQ